MIADCVLSMNYVPQLAKLYKGLCLSLTNEDAQTPMFAKQRRLTVDGPVPLIDP